MNEVILPLTLFLWMMLILRHKHKHQVYPPPDIALSLAIQGYAIVSGLIICSGSFLGWPRVTFEEYRWIIGLGSIALFYLAFDKVRREVS